MKDIDEIRRANIRRLELDMGSPSEFATALGMSGSQYSNLRDGAKDSRTGKPRGMRKETAWKFEDVANKPRGWLDQDHSTKPEFDSEDKHFLEAVSEGMTERALAEFSKRLNELCDDMQVPPKGRARQTSLAKIFDVSQKGARKWLECEGYCSIGMGKRIAAWASVSFDWLMTGEGEKHPGGNAPATALPPPAPRDPILDDLAALHPDDAEVWRLQIKAAAIKARRAAAERAAIRDAEQPPEPATPKDPPSALSPRSRAAR